LCAFVIAFACALDLPICVVHRGSCKQYALRSFTLKITLSCVFASFPSPFLLPPSAMSTFHRATVFTLNNGGLVGDAKVAALNELDEVGLRYLREDEV
jgi:hypothetical protein